MMKTNSQKRILPLALSGGILICLICIYSGRSVLLRSIVNRHTSRIEQTHGLCIHYDKLEMNGLNEIYLQGLSVIPEQRDTLFTLASTRIKLNFWKLLTISDSHLQSKTPSPIMIFSLKKTGKFHHKHPVKP